MCQILSRLVRLLLKRKTKQLQRQRLTSASTEEFISQLIQGL